MKPDKITEAAPGSEDAQNAHDNGCSCGSAEHAGVPSPECMPDEELLYDLADLFKVFGDTTPPRKAPSRTSCARSSRPVS